MVTGSGVGMGAGWAIGVASIVVVDATIVGAGVGMVAGD